MRNSSYAVRVARIRKRLRIDWNNAGLRRPFAVTPEWHGATFDPADYQLVQELIGVGGESVTHATPLDADDYLNNPQTFGIDTPVWEGGRFVDDAHVYADDAVGDLLDPQPWFVHVPGETVNTWAGENWSDVAGPLVLEIKL